MKLNHLTVLIVLATCFTWLSNSNGALPQNTGAPGDLTCGRAPCHNIPVNVGDASIGIDVNNGAEAYQPGSTHTLTVSISDAQSPRNGFQIVALDENNENIGTWILTTPGEMKIIDGIGLPRKYVTHQSAGNMQNSWTLDWEAPQEDVGDITFYASVLDANNNGNNMGDAVYTTSNTLSADVSNGVDNIGVGMDFDIHPNPAGNLMSISSKALIYSATLYSVQGQRIESWEVNKKTGQLALPNVPAGVYLLQVHGQKGNATNKLWISKE